MATAKGKAAFQHMLATLKENKRAKFSEVAEAAKKAGHKIYPIMYGRAQALLGIVKMRARKKKAFLAAAASSAGAALSKAGKRLGRPPGTGKNQRASRVPTDGAAALHVHSGDLATAQALIDALHSGKRATLHYHSGAWVLSAD